MKDPNTGNNTWSDTLPSPLLPTSAEIEIPLHDEPDPASTTTPAPALSPLPATAPLRLSLWGWIREGLRATVFLAPRTAAAAPTPWQSLWLTLIGSALLVGAQRWQVVGAAEFNLRGWIAPYWTTLVLLWLGWWAMDQTRRRRLPLAATSASASGTQSAMVPAALLPVDSSRDAPVSGGLAAWYVLSILAPLPPAVLIYGLGAVAAHQPAMIGEVVLLVAVGAVTLWMLAALVVMSGRFIQSRWRTAVFALGVAGVIAVGAWQFPDPPWEAVDPAMADASGQADDGLAQGPQDPPPDEEPRHLVLSQAVFEGQQALWRQQVDALLPERPGVVDVYGLVFAPYAEENVFRRESTMVSTLLQERFDARGRVLHLLNHADTAATHAWATPENLQRAVAALGARMDREHDVLVIYMTSHGARNHELAAANGPLEVPPATPEMLRAALDAAGIRNRVIAVSACYSGGWIPALETEHTLVMTAADATHTSYGCGSLSPLTFFGRAVFDEQLRTTHSFADAFAKAVPVIAQREVDAGKADGFSNPQIRVGTQITPVLQALEQRLDAAAAAVPPAAPDKAKAPAPVAPAGGA